MKRRDFLKYTSLLAAGSLYPRVFAQALAPSRRRPILIELKGGNDGLNTLVPFQSRDYQRIRTKLHLKPEEVKIVDQRLGLGLNKSLEFLHSEFESQKVAIFHSVGYANPNIPFFKLTLGGFDTHTNQKQRHAKLLGTLDNGLRDLVTGLKTLDAYDETLILTYSEFGRRPMENGNQGTDHGTANCHFAIGGRVRGKIYHGKDGLGDGGKPGQGGYELDSIKDTSQVLVSKMDFKDIYETVLTRWWGTGGLEGKRLAINFL